MGRTSLYLIYTVYCKQGGPKWGKLLDLEYMGLLKLICNFPNFVRNAYFILTYDFMCIINLVKIVFGALASLVVDCILFENCYRHRKKMWYKGRKFDVRGLTVSKESTSYLPQWLFVVIQ